MVRPRFSHHPHHHHLTSSPKSPANHRQNPATAESSLNPHDSSFWYRRTSSPAAPLDGTGDVRFEPTSPDITLIESPPLSTKTIKKAATEFYSSEDHHDLLLESRQYNDLLLALAGHLDSRHYLEPGDISTIQWEDFQAAFLRVNNGCCLPRVEELLELARMYGYLKREYLEQFEMECDNLVVFNLKELVNRALKKTYLKDLLYCDGQCRAGGPMIGLNCMLTNRRLLFHTLAILKNLTEDNAVLIFMKLNAKYNSCLYDLADINQGLSDPFFEAAWNWMLTGEVPYSFQAFFYIDPPPLSSLAKLSAPPQLQIQLSSDLKEKNYLNWAKFPTEIVDRSHGATIYNIGILVRFLKANGQVQTNLQLGSDQDQVRNELFRRFFNERAVLYELSIQFRFFLAEVKTFVFEHVLQVAKAKEEFLASLELLKGFYLFEDEHFWTSYALITRQKDGVHKLKHFTKALKDAYGLSAEEDDRFRQVNVVFLKVESTSPLLSPPLRLTINHGPLVKMFHSEQTLPCYQAIFDRLYPLHAAKTALTASWKAKKDAWKEEELKAKKVGETERKKEKEVQDQSSLEAKAKVHHQKTHYLRYRLLATITTLLTYCRFVIRQKVGGFERAITSKVDVNAIQESHDACLRQIAQRLFIGEKFILFTNLQEKLLQLSEELQRSSAEENGSNVDEQFEEYNGIVQLFGELFAENPEYIAAFGEVTALNGILAPFRKDYLSSAIPEVDPESTLGTVF